MLSEDAAEEEFWLPEPPEQGFPSFTRTGTATRLGELEDCNKLEVSVLRQGRQRLVIYQGN